MNLLEVRADRKDGIYHQGKMIKFAVNSKGIPKSAEINYIIRRDGVETVKSGKARLGAVIEIKAEQPGFLNIAVTYKELQSQAACGIDPLRIKPCMPRPNDFKSFWAGKLKELAEVPMAPRVKKIPAPSEADYQAWNTQWPFFGDTPRQFLEIVVFEIEADTLGGEPVRGYYAFPAGAAPKSLPAVLFTHGAGIGDSDLGKTCAAAQHGFLAMDINAHGLLMEQPADYYAAVTKEIQETCGSFFKKGRLDKETFCPVTMYLRHRRALDFLCSRTEWNGRNLVVRGASQGGCLALVCAGLDGRVSCVCAGVPAFCGTPRDFSMQRWFLNEHDDEKTIAQVRDVARYIAIENFAPDIKAQAYFTVAFLDSGCHPTDVYAAYNVYGGPKKIYNGPTSDHGGIPASIHYSDFTKFMREHVAKK